MFFFVVVATPGFGFKGTEAAQTGLAGQENHKGLFFFLKVLYESGDFRIGIVFVVVTVFYLFSLFSVPANRRCTSAKASPLLLPFVFRGLSAPPGLPHLSTITEE